MATGQTWVITSVEYSGDDVNWTSIWSGNANTAAIPYYGVIFNISGGIGSGYLTGQTTPDSSTQAAAITSAAPSLAAATSSTTVATPDGFYMVNVSTTVNYAATVNGTQQQGQATGGSATSETVAEITGVAVGSPATETNMIQDYPNQGDINYGTVEATSTNATAAATTSPATAPVEKEIKWANGTAVQGNNAQRNYPLATSQKYTIDPTLGGHDWKGHNVYLWVIWATVTIDDTQGAANPPNAPPFTLGGDDFGGNNLGLFYNATKTACGFQNCQIAKMTPVGVHNVVSGGCVMVQKRQIHDFANVTQHGQFWDMQWTPDGPSSTFYTKTPDSEDKVYATDNPSQFLQSGETQDDEYGNFRDHLEWNGTVCSPHAYWYFEAGAKQGDNPVIYFAQGGTGQITIPNADPQKALNSN